MSQEELVLQEAFDSNGSASLGACSSASANVDLMLEPVQIKAAQCSRDRQLAFALVGRRYESRGYKLSTPSAAPVSDMITLTAQRGDEVVGTLSVRFDGDEGLASDEVFGDVLAQLRESGHQLCEFTRFAIDGDESARRVQLSLFHSAYVVAYRLRSAKTLLVEVNPRHVGFYRRMLGFKVVGTERMNPRVGAPAVLMMLDLAWTQQQLLRYGGQPGLARVARNLFPCFDSPLQEQHMLAALRRDIGSVH